MRVRLKRAEGSNSIYVAEEKSRLAKQIIIVSLFQWIQLSHQDFSRWLQWNDVEGDKGDFNGDGYREEVTLNKSAGHNSCLGLAGRTRTQTQSSARRKLPERCAAINLDFHLRPCHMTCCCRPLFFMRCCRARAEHLGLLVAEKKQHGEGEESPPDGCRRARSRKMDGYDDWY